MNDSKLWALAFVGCELKNKLYLSQWLGRPFTEKSLNELRLLVPSTPLYDSIKREFEELTEKGVKWACAFDGEYPQGWDQLEKAPMTFFYKGRPIWKESSCFSVVGSRNPSKDSVLWMETYLSRFIKSEPDITYASGGALGVDQFVHGQALINGARTLAVVPTGILDLYPKNLETIGEAILEQDGALLSPFSPWTPVRRYHFAFRNSLLVALSDWVLVVQAGAKSGSFMTGNLACRYGRDLMCLSPPPMAPHFKGNLNLIRRGAISIYDDLDLKMHCV